MNNLSYIVVIFLFAGIIWVGIDRREYIKQMAADKEAAMIADQQARIDAQNDAENARLADLDKFIQEISHDRNPETDLFEVKLQAVSADAENDDMSYEWTQVPVSSDYVGGDQVNLSSNDKPTAYFEAPAGEYRFELTVTDAYGASSSSSADVNVNAEPNDAPVADAGISFNAESGLEVIPPTLSTAPTRMFRAKIAPRLKLPLVCAPAEPPPKATEGV